MVCLYASVVLVNHEDVKHIMIKRTVKILEVAALLVVWLAPVEAQGAYIDGAGFVEPREGKLFHVEQSN